MTRAGSSYSGTDIAAPAGSSPGDPTRPNSLGSAADTQAQLANLQRSNASVPQGGLSVIDNGGPDRNADFNDSAQLRTVLARGAPPGRNGAQVFAQQVEGAAIPLAQRAQQQALQTKEQGANQRSTLEQQGLAARAQITDARQQESNSIDRARLGIEAARAGSAGVPSGYRMRADGSGLEFIPGGPADPSSKAGGGKPLTEGQGKALLFGTRMQASNQILADLEKGGKLFSTPGANTGYGVGAVVNLANSKEGQQLDQAKRDFLNAVLRRESGAVIADTEFASGDKQYFPQPGDSKEVIEQKRRNRELATRGILAEVPGAEERVAQVRGAAAAPAAAGRPPPPAAGAQEDGYTFIGGDPADPKSWRKS
ncbi:hypothetical protein [Variovorax sp. DXTD-1]|uniref:hypothetical protein n=1 Tax=Variovorax sp. DXTD-1 TaxID=2495592 RepID=UPI000F89203D|nr:hypothetical protein [Variovorax sp. DXTD-1]RST54092.1 hypothetical protein EJI00_02905 [Variovorax sp. DXTD-1]